MGDDRWDSDFEDFDADMQQLQSRAEAARARMAATPPMVPLSSVLDPAFAAELEAIIARNERDPRFQARERARQREKDREEREWGENMITSALRGGFGKACQSVAEELTDNGRRTDSRTVRDLQRQLQKMRATDHSVPTLRMSR